MNLGLAVLLGAILLGVLRLDSSAWFERPAVPAIAGPEGPPVDVAPAAERASTRPESRAASDSRPAGTAEPNEPRSGAGIERTSLAGDWAIRGAVIDQDDAPIERATVWLIRGSRKLEQAIDERGSFAFAQLDAGTYQLRVDARSLDEGVLPPWRQHESLPYSGRATGVFGTTVTLSNEAGRDVDLRVFVGGVVGGRLVDALGQPLPRSLVAIKGTHGIESAARTNAQGRFEITGAYPGDYRTYVTLDRTAVAPATQAPLPVEFTLRPGAELDLGDLTAGRR